MCTYGNVGLLQSHTETQTQPSKAAMSPSTARSTKVALPGLSAQVAVVVSACLVLLCCASGSSSHVQAAPVPIIIDTDIGIGNQTSKASAKPSVSLSRAHSLLVCPLLCTAMDDTWAIALILSRPDVFDVKLICTSTGNSTARARVRVCGGLSRT